MLKLIERDGKEFFGNYGGFLIEATMDNIESTLEIHRRVLNDIEESYNKQQKEILRLNTIKEFIIKKKYCSYTVHEKKMKDGNKAVKCKDCDSVCWYSNQDGKWYCSNPLCENSNSHTGFVQKGNSGVKNGS